MNLPGRKFAQGSGYRYGFNGKENDKEISEGGQDYGMRIYDPRTGRFLSEDPLNKSYPMLSAYQFAGNIPIRYIDLDGLEPADYKKGAKHLVIVNLGYGGSAKEGKTQAKNGLGDEEGGLSSYFTKLANNPEVEVVIFNSSIMDATEDDIVQTVKNFNAGTKSLNIGKTVSFVGHSLGADQLMETLEENNVSADLFVSLDLAAGPMNDYETVEKGSDVKLVIAFYQKENSPGGNVIDSKNPTTTVVNFEVKSTHKTIDNQLGATAATLVEHKIAGASDAVLIKEAEGAAKTFNTSQTPAAKKTPKQ